ncbi:MAG TPA: ribose 5-phosphate isomerase B [bacterium]
MTIAVGSDHRGIELKNKIATFLKEKGIRVQDQGAFTTDTSDYPTYALKVAMKVKNKKARFGILVCYSGQGMAIAANKVKGIRAAVAWEPEIGRLARAHNNANIIVLPAGFIKTAKQWRGSIQRFLNTKFEGNRHQKRLDIINKYENMH